MSEVDECAFFLGVLTFAAAAGGGATTAGDGCLAGAVATGVTGCATCIRMGKGANADSGAGAGVSVGGDGARIGTGIGGDAVAGTASISDTAAAWAPTTSVSATALMTGASTSGSRVEGRPHKLASTADSTSGGGRVRDLFLVHDNSALGTAPGLASGAAGSHGGDGGEGSRLSPTLSAGKERLVFRGTGFGLSSKQLSLTLPPPPPPSSSSDLRPKRRDTFPPLMTTFASSVGSGASAVCANAAPRGELRPLAVRLRGEGARCSKGARSGVPACTTCERAGAQLRIGVAEAEGEAAEEETATVAAVTLSSPRDAGKPRRTEIDRPAVEECVSRCSGSERNGGDGDTLTDESTTRMRLITICPPDTRAGDVGRETRDTSDGDPGTAGKPAAAFERRTSS